MKSIFLFLFGLIAFSAFGQVTISEEDFAKLPKETQQRLRPDTTNVVMSKLEETSKAVSIGTEIGTAVSATLGAVKESVLDIADSDVGKTAIGIAMWKLLWKDIVGIVAGAVLFGFSMFFGIRATRRANKDDDDDDLTARRIISGIATAVLFIASMCSLFG